jgi:hypothetical protein
MAKIAERPELGLVRGALLPSVLSVPGAFVGGWAFGGPGIGFSAAIGVAIVGLNFCANGVSLAWASTNSLSAVRIVALGGSVVRLGIIVAAMFALNTLPWFSPLAFGWAVVPATVFLLAYEARLALLGVGGSLQIPPDPVAVRAAEALAAREASLDAR